MVMVQLETVGSIQTCSFQFNQLLRQQGPGRYAPLNSVTFWRQWGQCRHASLSQSVSEIVGTIQTYSSQFSQLLRQWVHADMLLSVKSPSGESGAMQTCSSQFTLPLDTVGSMQTSYSQFSQLLETGRALQICLYQFSHILRQWGPCKHALLSSACGDSGGHADRLFSVSQLLRQWGP